MRSYFAYTANKHLEIHEPVVPDLGSYTRIFTPTCEWCFVWAERDQVLFSALQQYLLEITRAADDLTCDQASFFFFAAKKRKDA